MGGGFADEHERDRVDAGVARLEVDRRVVMVRRGPVVFVRRQAVMMVGVIVFRVRMDMAHQTLPRECEESRKQEPCDGAHDVSVGDRQSESNDRDRCRSTGPS